MNHETLRQVILDQKEENRMINGCSIEMIPAELFYLSETEGRPFSFQ